MLLEQLLNILLAPLLVFDVLVVIHSLEESQTEQERAKLFRRHS